MLGWINDCIEKMVIEQFGLDVWHTVKEKAGCQVADDGFLKLECYTDKSTIALVNAASEISGLTFDGVFEAFGIFFVHYIRKQGYDNLLCCQGSTLKSWMQNINAIHHHLQSTFPKKMTMPEFWCEDEDASEDANIILHYNSRRGNILAPVAKGLVEEVARFQFGVEICMEVTCLQGVDGAKATSWRVSAKNPREQWKLRQKQGGRDGKVNVPTSFKCPFSGVTGTIPSRIGVTANDTSSTISATAGGSPISKCPAANNEDTAVTSSSSSTLTSATWQSLSSSKDSLSTSLPGEKCSDIGLSGTATKSLFPYHIVMDDKFKILQVGKDLPEILRSTEEKLLGDHVNTLLEIIKPFNAVWNWEWLRKLEDQSFVVEPARYEVDLANLVFKATIVQVSDNDNAPSIMIVMAPDANSLDELREMNLTLSDLPVHGAHRDAVFLREHLSTQMNSALTMEKLSKTLAREKNLLESLLPQHAADGLRAGRAVEPRMHKNVTLFFSDIVGFTNLAGQMHPTQVIGLLNRLYSVMDFLAIKFNLFKVETIGDAYVCCSGLPTPDDQHAENVANFAIAVSHCCKQVVSPLKTNRFQSSGEPIQLRIGIHTGECASGVVGMTNPRYCLFGDSVNTAARHESSGKPNKIHCSYVTRENLKDKDYKLTKRGMVYMKGKGDQLTYWLASSRKNKFVNKAALRALDVEVKELLEKTKLKAAAEGKGTITNFTASARPNVNTQFFQ